MRGRILIVEPYEPIRDLLATVLRRTGQEVVTAGNGNEAVAAMEREHFPCVVVGSPVAVDTRGEKVLFLSYIERHCPQWRPCLVVVTTHVEAGEIVAVAQRLGVCAVLAKPFAAEDLLAMVEACLAGRHAPTRWIGVPDLRTAAATLITQSGGLP